uniref:Small subunit ribosomal protein S15 n=1 Tax=Rhipicephalus appendiculatus TaxID=34631 RepID=A0A131Z556_RHIAP
MITAGRALGYANMGGLARLSCSVRMLFSKMSIAQATTADFHCAAAATDTSLLRSRSPTRVCRRFRNRKILSWPTDYLPFEWSYPAPPDVIAKCGDGDIGPTDPTMPLNGFELSDELKTAPPEVKKVFSLQLASLVSLSPLRHSGALLSFAIHLTEADSRSKKAQICEALPEASIRLRFP